MVRSLADRTFQLRFTLADSGLAFVIAGFPFSGSTSLSAIVAAHPDVELPSEQLTWNVAESGRLRPSGAGS